MTDRIKAALAALDKATPGPWHIGNGKVSDLYQGWNAILANADDGGRFVLATVNHNYEELAKYNAPLIAAAPDLAAEVIRLRKWQKEAVPYLHKEIEQCKAVLGIGICDCEVCTAARIRGKQLTRLIAEAEGE